MPDSTSSPLSETPGNLTVTATSRRTTWGEIAVCGLILGMAFYLSLFAVLLADALFFDRNVLLKPIENNSKFLATIIGVIYYPEIVLLKLFRVIPG